MMKRILPFLLVGLCAISHSWADFIIQSGNFLNQSGGPVNFDTDNDSVVDNAMNTAGNLGISTATPEHTLHVIGSANITEELTIGANINLSSNLLVLDQLLMPDGSNSNPPIAFASDTDTGYYMYAAGRGGFSTGGNLTFIHDSNQNVGIGTVAPTNRFQIDTTATDDTLNVSNTNGRVSFGTASLNSTVNIGGERTITFMGGNGILDGNGLLSLVSTDSTAWVINGSQIRCYGTDLSGVLNIPTRSDDQKGFVFRANSASQTANLLEIQSSAGGNLFQITAEGYVGVRTINKPTQALEVDGNIVPSANATYTLGTSALAWDHVYCNDLIMISDRRLKENIRELDEGYDEIQKLRAVTFKWNKEGAQGGKNLGFIAQEVDEVLPKAVTRPSSPDQPLGVNYLQILPVLIKAYQEQETRIKEIEKDLVTRRQLNDRIEKALRPQKETP